MSELNIKDVNGKVIMPDSLGGIDVSNILGTNPPVPYTAPQDCWIVAESISQYFPLRVDGVTVLKKNMGDQNTEYYTAPVFVKKGQVVDYSNETVRHGNYIVYGLKY